MKGKSNEGYCAEEKKRPTKVFVLKERKRQKDGCGVGKKRLKKVVVRKETFKPKSNIVLEERKI